MGQKKVIEYNDGLLPRSLRPNLYLVQDGLAYRFDGQSISGVCAVMAQTYEKAGKWSNTTYRIMLATGVTPVRFDGWRDWLDNCANFSEVADTLGVTEEVARQILSRPIGNRFPGIDGDAETWSEVIERKEAEQAALD